VTSAVKEAIAGGRPMSRGIGAVLLEHVRRSSRTSSHQWRAIRPLSDRESAVLTQLARGLSYEDIACLLGVSLNTVRTFVRQVYEKLDVNSRTEAVVVGIRLGLVKGTPYPGVRAVNAPYRTERRRTRDS
jgi:DNA-binding NarL/FixJ family response regulator